MKSTFSLGEKEKSKLQYYSKKRESGDVILFIFQKEILSSLDEFSIAGFIFNFELHKYFENKVLMMKNSWI